MQENVLSTYMRGCQWNTTMTMTSTDLVTSQWMDSLARQTKQEWTLLTRHFSHHCGSLPWTCEIFLIPTDDGTSVDICIKGLGVRVRYEWVIYWRAWECVLRECVLRGGGKELVHKRIHQRAQFHDCMIWSQADRWYNWSMFSYQFLFMTLSLTLVFHYIP